ncbi:aminoglycoside phosphotransferase family protein [Streptomyces longhuiensis]|uniref:aminoglycoside phosphotransferase family protein n=1 Tax=Streptomyces longhuiensis TaxID=2880933 RepID=UPI001D0BB814|nr:aminoglycoside phosphotransferase family protein [Streptomyces longhuiensis]UDL98733.1 aminoglycoside phosphotransferase family protein [Streptomyces longhuiensis]
MTAPVLLPALTATARGAAHPGPGPCACPAAGAVLADRADGTVVRHGDLVAKAHAPGTDPAELTARLATAAALPGILLPPLTPVAADLHDRLVTFWPHGSPVDPDAPERAPWEDAATLLARLHAVPTAELPGPLPPMRGPAKAALAVARLLAAGPHPASAPILRAWSGLPPWARAETYGGHASALCHGDLHLGQLVRRPAGTGPWLLIDVDDLGIGDPAWDLARPAAWFACGLLPAQEWTRFLTAYQAAGGAPSLQGDPWLALDAPARALTVQTAALAVAKAVAAGRALDEAEEALVDACDRMAAVPAELAHGVAK